MLVLSRKTGEVIHVGADIQIKIIGVEHGRVKVGIQAPGDIRVLLAEKFQEKMAAALNMAGEVIEQVIPLAGYMERKRNRAALRVA